MKKLFALLLVLFTGTMLFAATGSYVVKAVVGNVTYEAKPGVFEKVTVGQELSASTVLKTGLNSSVDINFEGKKITIKAKQNGTVESLYVAAAPTKGNSNFFDLTIGHFFHLNCQHMNSWFAKNGN